LQYCCSHIAPRKKQKGERNKEITGILHEKINKEKGIVNQVRTHKRTNKAKAKKVNELHRLKEVQTL